MNDSTPDDRPQPPPAGSGYTSPEPLELAMEALASGRAPDPTARTLLQRQTRLVEMQIQQIHLRRWLLGVVAALLLIGTVAVLRAAARDSSLVIEAFTAPPDLEAQGLGGETLAGLMLDKLATMDAQTDSFRSHETLKNDWSGDIKVEIPNTGISIGQLDRGLRRWLGHQTRVAGSVFHRGDKLVLALHGSGGLAREFSAPADALEPLLQQGAEAVYHATQPDQFSKYLEEHDRGAEALAVAREVAASGPLKERAWGYAQIANLLFSSDIPGALEAGRRAVELDPDNSLALLNYSGAQILLGHDEDGLRNLARGGRMAKAGGNGLSEAGILFGVINIGGYDDMSADYGAALRFFSSPQAEVSYYGYTQLVPGLRASELAHLHEVAAAAAVPGVLPDTDLPKYLSFWNQLYLPAYDRAVESQDWAAALADLEEVDRAGASQGYLGNFARQRMLPALRAQVLAHLHRFAEAREALAALPLDCYPCVRARGVVAGLAGDAAAADRWFGEAQRQAPSLPFAYYEWGQAKLERGDAQGATSLFRQAEAKAPHWADPYKAEGDALVRLKETSGALDRYAAAGQYAPRWGALHLAWGRAFDALQRRDEARARYQAAAGMDLTAADRAAVNSLLGSPAVP
ncbi:MAG TPA: hypothetical protein VFA75_13835 [Nevskia sp.]|nr:hypothetical protein [Nevskia sp.]